MSIIAEKPHALITRRNRAGRRRHPATAVVLALGIIVLGACSEDGVELPTDVSVELPEGSLPDATLPDVEAPEIEAPELEAPEVEAPEVEAPEVEVPGEDTGADSDVPIWAFVLLGLIIVGFIAYFGARSGSKRAQAPLAAPPAPSPPPSGDPEWKRLARAAYADARWLHDEMDVDLGTWRGDTLYETQNGAATMSSDPTKQSTWNQLPSRMNAARQALYRVESMAPRPEIAQAATALGTSLTGTKSALDRLAEARRTRRSAEGATAGPPADIDAGRAAETRAADDLASERRSLNDATMRFSSMT